MMQESYISRTKLVVVVLWTAVIALMVGAWGAMCTLATWDPSLAVAMLALTAGVLAPVAAVAHLRVYHMKVAQLVRITGGLAPQVPSGSDEAVGLRSVPR